MVPVAYDKLLVGGNWLLVQWKDGSKQWVPLTVLKASNPVDVAEYAKARGLDSEPAFA
jgi:hypothetical protein